MRVTCPACQAEMSLDVLMAREADARAVAGLLERHVALGDVLVRYVGLFRPAKRRLSLARVVALLEELMPDIERGAIARRGRDWPVDAATWRAGIEAIFTKRDKGTLTLPLTSHGLLYEVMCSLADKAEAVAEAQGEAERRHTRPAGVRGGPVGITALVAVDGAAPGAAPVAAPAALPDYSKPSRSAQRLKAQMQAALAARSQATASDTSTDPAAPEGAPDAAA